MLRRTFLGGTLSAVAVGACEAQPVTATSQNAIVQVSSDPLVWPIVTKLQPGIRSFVGHADTVLDVIGRVGAPPSLVIFTEGNHLMVLSSDDVVGAFPSWAKSQPQYADLDLTNIILVTLPQPILVQMIRSGGVALGNLTLDVSRTSGFYPDIFMGYPEPLRQLHQFRVIEPQARFFCKNRGVALLVRKGNPLGIRGLADVVRTGTRIALPEFYECARDYSAFMPANLTTLAHFSVSAAMSLPKSTGEPASTVPPNSASRAFILGSVRATLISLLSFSIISKEVFFGAPTPPKLLAS
jgi:hypothetical protein